MKVFHESASNVAVDNVLREVAILKVTLPALHKSC